MQFHAVKQNGGVNRGEPTRETIKKPISTASAARVSSIAADTEVIVLPGRLQSIKQWEGDRQRMHGPSWSIDNSTGNQNTTDQARKTDEGSRRVIPGKTPHEEKQGQQGKQGVKRDRGHDRIDLAPEPVNYLRLRRTEESKVALARNRTHPTVAHEILQPTSPIKQSTSVFPNPIQLQLERDEAKIFQAARKIEAMERRILHPNHTKTTGVAAVLESQLQQLYQTKAQLERESQAAAQHVQRVLTNIRSDMTLMHKFTPLFRIYARHKVKSGWQHWIKYVTWHRQERARIALLWPRAIQIQRIFRWKRNHWTLARKRLDAAWDQWNAAKRVQRGYKHILRQREGWHHVKLQRTVTLQASWRGYIERRRVKRALQDQLRWLLRSLSPTGNLYSLQAIIQGSPELSRPLNAMLALVEETAVTVEADSVYKAKNLRVAAHNASKAIPATRRQLISAIHELRNIIVQREQFIEEMKNEFVVNQQRKHRVIELHVFEQKAKKLEQTKAKITQQTENTRMREEELKTREHLRMLKTANDDRIIRIQLRQKRRENEENSLMVVEEYHTRYYVSEMRRRAHDTSLRMQEVSKREQFMKQQLEEQMNLLDKIRHAHEAKQKEARAREEQLKREEQLRWSVLSKEQQILASQRKLLKEKSEEEQKNHISDLERVLKEQHLEIARKREERRSQKLEEIAREQRARDHMDQEEKYCRKVYFAMRKISHVQTWQAKREKEVVKYSLDPLHFSKIQEIKEQEERERRERYSMKKEEEVMTVIHDKERKERYFQECRERKKRQKAEALIEGNERLQMDIEDKMERERCAALAKTEDFKRTLARMKALAESTKLKEEQRLMEARCRRMMHEEEIQQRRVGQAHDLLQANKEKYERHAMAAEDLQLHLVFIEIDKQQEKREREKRIFRMMKEDVASMEGLDWETEGKRLEELLWSPADAAAFRHLITRYNTFLFANVKILRELGRIKECPPMSLDYEAVLTHVRDKTEDGLSLDTIPRKKRLPRKFFYHEFFESDPMLTSPVQDHLSQPSRARERWKRLSEHYLGQAWHSSARRNGYRLMTEGRFIEAFDSLRQALRVADTSVPTKEPLGVIRQIARCCHKQWELCFDRSWLEKSLFFYHRVSTHVVLLANPTFLQEVALVLEHSCKYQEAAEVLAGIISCFPRYSKLNEAIFRGGIVMFSLAMYRQSREYILHTLEAPPFGWESFEILFVVARIMQFEGEPSRKLCAVAYDEAFRTNKREAFYRIHTTWRDCIKAADTWRQLGDRYFARREFVLARDAYHMMMKRQTKRNAHLLNKRQLALEAIEAAKRVNVLAATPNVSCDDEDWLRIARCHAILNDSVAANTAMLQWLAQKSYEERVLERFYAWPLVRWKLLGLDVPQAIWDVRDIRAKEKEAAENERRKAIDQKRQRILKERSTRFHLRSIAWSEDTQPPAQGRTSDTTNTPLVAITDVEDTTTSLHAPHQHGIPVVAWEVATTDGSAQNAGCE